MITFGVNRANLIKCENCAWIIIIGVNRSIWMYFFYVVLNLGLTQFRFAGLSFRLKRVRYERERTWLFFFHRIQSTSSCMRCVIINSFCCWVQKEMNAIMLTHFFSILPWWYFILLNVIKTSEVWIDLFDTLKYVKIESSCRIIFLLNEILWWFNHFPKCLHILVSWNNVMF